MSYGKEIIDLAKVYFVEPDLSNLNEEAQLIYLLFNDDSEKILIVLEADFDLIVALKRSIMPVLYAESFKKLLNKVKIQ